MEHAITFKSYRTLSPLLNSLRNRKEIMQVKVKVEVKTQKDEEKTRAQEEEKTEVKVEIETKDTSSPSFDIPLSLIPSGQFSAACRVYRHSGDSESIL
jgi:hypothetical protein